jgi:TfoX/Sxy family transcriptional regulator of competence genes
MAYDEALAERIRAVLADRDNVTEQKMFGGIAFMISDRMAVGVIHDDLMVRVGPDAHDDAVARPHVRPMDFTRRPMRGFVYVAPPALPTTETWRSGWRPGRPSLPPSRQRSGAETICPSR